MWSELERRKVIVSEPRRGDREGMSCMNCTVQKKNGQTYAVSTLKLVLGPP